METTTAAALTAVNAHHNALRLNRRDNLEARVWHLLVSVRQLCKTEDISADKLWAEAEEYAAAEH